MGRLRTITRRSFLVGSVAIGGAVAFGTYRAFAPFENPNEEDLASGSATWARTMSAKARSKVGDRSDTTIRSPHNSARLARRPTPVGWDSWWKTRRFRCSREAEAILTSAKPPPLRRPR